MWENVLYVHVDLYIYYNVLYSFHCTDPYTIISHRLASFIEIVLTGLQVFHVQRRINREFSPYLYVDRFMNNNNLYLLFLHRSPL